MAHAINIPCTNCKRSVSVTVTEGWTTVICPFCKTAQRFETTPGIDPNALAADAGIACILCGCMLSSTIEDPRAGDRHVALVCGAHTDEDLSARGLSALWAGGDTRPGDIHTDPTRRLAGAWELGTNGAHAVYLLLDNGDLLIIAPDYDGVATARVPRDRRLHEQPLGLSKHNIHPWGLAVAEGTNITSIRRREDGRIDLALAGRGIVAFSVYLASWRELGDGKYFLAEDWLPRY